MGTQVNCKGAQGILGFSGGTAVKNLPASARDARIQVGSLSQEDPLEEEKATLSSLLSWEIPWTEEPGRLCPQDHKRIRHD